MGAQTNYQNATILIHEHTWGLSTDVCQCTLVRGVLTSIAERHLDKPSLDTTRMRTAILAQSPPG